MLPLWTLAAYDLPSITADGAMVYATSEDGQLRGYEAATGKLDWTARPPSGRFTREEAYGDGVVSLFLDGETTGICRLDSRGQRRWCHTSERPVFDLAIGLAGSGLGIFDQSKDLRVLDAETGRPLGDWLEGAEWHIYEDLSQPHDTMFLAAATILGRFGNITVVATRAGVMGLRPDGSAAWSRPLQEGAAATMGAGGRGLVFAHRSGPSVSGAGRLWLVDSLLLSLGEQGELLWDRKLPDELAGRLVEGGFVVGPGSVTAVDLQRGTVRWTVPVDGMGAVVGERGRIGYRRDPDDGTAVVWVDGATGEVVGRTPLGRAAGLVEAASCGLVVGSLHGAWECLDAEGRARWSFKDPIHRAEIFGEIAVRYPKEGPSELVDLATGGLLGALEGSVLARAGSSLLVSHRGYAIYRVPNSTQTRPRPAEGGSP